MRADFPDWERLKSRAQRGIAYRLLDSGGFLLSVTEKVNRIFQKTPQTITNRQLLAKKVNLTTDVTDLQIQTKLIRVHSWNSQLLLFDLRFISGNLRRYCFG